MNNTTKKALKASITAWEEKRDNDDHDDIDMGIAACHLCQLFIGDDVDRDCIGCPVAEFTGKISCYDTPYNVAWNARRKWRNGEGTQEQWKEAAQAEIDFLKSLLPQEKKENGL